MLTAFKDWYILYTFTYKHYVLKIIYKKMIIQ